MMFVLDYSVLIALSLLAARPMVDDTPEEAAQFFPSQLDLSAPAGPALSVLGVDASKATTPANLQDLAANVVNSFDESGKLKQGFQITASFGALRLAGKYAKGGTAFYKDFDQRIKWAPNLSLAAVKGSSEEDKSARLAIGLSIPIFDDSDWRGDKKAMQDFAKLVETTYGMTPTPPAAPGSWDGVSDSEASTLRLKWMEFANWLRGLSIPSDEQRLVREEAVAAVNKAASAPRDKALYDAAFDASNTLIETLETTDSATISKNFGEGLKKLSAENDKKFWNKRKLVVSFAHSLFAADGSKDTPKGDGTFAWLSYAQPFTEKGQLTLFARYGNKDRSFDGDAKTWIVGNSTQLGARLKGGNAKSGLFVEYLSKELQRGGGADIKQAIWQGGYETNIGNGQWLQIALGRGSGKGISRNLLGINFTFNLGASPELVKH